MARIIASALIESISGKVSSADDSVFRTNKRTNRIFAHKGYNYGPGPRTEAQQKNRHALGARSRAASEWNRANRPSAEHPEGTPLYQALRAAYERQHKTGNFFAFIVKCTTEDGEVVVSQQTEM